MTRSRTPERQERDRDRRLRKRYGITAIEYDRLLEVHDGGCWVCGKKMGARRLHVDHDHKLKGRGSVRGILCWPCNRLLTRGMDKPAILRAAADYLESRRAQEVLDAEV